jgi:hypothetical protein
VLTFGSYALGVSAIFQFVHYLLWFFNDGVMLVWSTSISHIYQWNSILFSRSISPSALCCVRFKTLGLSPKNVTGISIISQTSQQFVLVNVVCELLLGEALSFSCATLCSDLKLHCAMLC